MIPPRPISLLLPFIIALQGCGEEEVEYEPEGPRSRGPQVDLDEIRNDPLIKSFESESASYRGIMAELRTLDAKLAGEGLTEQERDRWAELSRQADGERRRLNAIMYAPDVDADQRAAMWWFLQPEATTSGND